MGGAGSIVPLVLVVTSPLLCNFMAFISMSPELSEPTLSAFTTYCTNLGWADALTNVLYTFCLPSNVEAWIFFGVFMLLAAFLCLMPGSTRYGPATATGHVPKYTDNGLLHCFLFSAVFFGCSNLGAGLYDVGVIYDVFPPLIGALNITGLLFCLFLYVKGLSFPSTKDCGSSGSVVIDYYWGTELYPRFLGLDVKRLVNCRFSMTFWMLAGLSFTYRSFTIHGRVDYGLLLSAVSQYLYLVKFFAWEIGYMRSIDIIVDRAGFYETWGCLVWVPSLYTLHTRVLVRAPSHLSLEVSVALFVLSLVGVFLNFWADKQREWFREANGEMNIFGRKAEFVRAEYSVVENGKLVKKTSLLLASGFWGVARHFHYLFELTAAWSWGLLGNPLINGVVPLFYPIFLTILLFDRARRDEEKCLKKYGEDYKKYAALVRHYIIPGIY